MFKDLNRGISIPLIIILIAVLIITAVVFKLTYECYFIGTPNIESPEAIKHPRNDFSKLDKDVLLHKLFPNLTFTDGIANHTETHSEHFNLYLEDSIEGYFANNKEKTLLLIVRLDGVPHVDGLYHTYLGLFDKNGSLLTSTSSYDSEDYDFYTDQVQFGGDQGGFGFYDCQGIKYIAFVSHGCPNRTCCFGNAALFKIKNNSFEEVQTINNTSLAENNGVAESDYGLKISLLDEKMIIKKVPDIMQSMDDPCPESDYRVLNWNKDTCRFE